MFAYIKIRQSGWTEMAERGSLAQVIVMIMSIVTFMILIVVK